MNANGLRFWLLADQQDWRLTGTPPLLTYHQQRRSLRLASPLPPLDAAALPNDRAEASARLAHVPVARDSYGTEAYWDAASGDVMARGALPDSVPIFRPEGGTAPTDITIGYDGILYLAHEGRIIMQDRRGRWPLHTLALPGFVAWRLAAAPDGGVWALDRDGKQIARLTGEPLPTRPYARYNAGTFRPQEENPFPPQLAIWDTAVLPAAEEPTAIACNQQGQLAILNWIPDGAAVVRLLQDDGHWSAPVSLLGAHHPYSLAWVSPTQTAVLLPDLDEEAAVYTVIDATAAVQPDGDFYPLRDHDGGPFLNTITLPVYYPTSSGSSPLHPLSLPRFARQGTAENEIVIDSGSTQTVWHRLYLEALIPAKCDIRIHLAASDDLNPITDEQAWFPHHFGRRFSAAPRDGVPRGVWLSQPSELPHHPGLLPCPTAAETAGLFTVLIQRAGRRVRALRGRYLRVRVQLTGDGRSTPEIWALRPYASRFSYVDNYLPALFREDLFAPEADDLVSATAPPSPADFLERFVALFESELTPLEDSIANAHLLMDPLTTPPEALAWLASWIGLTFDPIWPAARQRTLLRHAPQLYRRHGTLNGLQLALDLATDGAVSRGQVIVLENWRLRRTFATILGADLAAEEDPLLAGLAVSGNSFVGDTLFLGDETRKEFLALFNANLVVTSAEADAITSFLDDLAFRVTLFVHDAVAPQDLGLIRRIAELEAPAHVITDVITASYPLMVGIASLVGIDTYLTDVPQPQPVEVGRSDVGRRDLLLRQASLDPRLRGERLDGYTAGERPVAAIDPAQITVAGGASFVLDGRSSRAAEGRQIVRYIWTRVE